MLLLCCTLAGSDAPEWKYEKAVASYEAKDQESPPADGGIMCIGSSTFTRWKTLTEDLAPLPVYNRAFGGSTTADVLRAAPRLVLPRKPKVVVYYCGDNDLSNPDKDDAVATAKGFTDFVTTVRSALPQTRFVYVSIKPSPKRVASWANAQAAHAAVKARCEQDPMLAFVDIAPAILDAQGQPRAELFVEDRLHLNAEGYRGITALIKPVVERAWHAANAQGAEEKH
jgi:lysophospholipase L1-like esterase